MEYLKEVFIITGMQLLIIFAPIIIIGFLMNYSSRIIENRLCSFLGIKLYLFLFGWLGTTVHETGHALFCIIFRHKINEIKFFSPDLETGTLGYVNHSYNPKSTYQNIGNFFIGIGPIILGSGIIYLLAYFLTDNSSMNLSKQELSLSLYIEQIILIFQNIFRIENLVSIKFYILIYIIFCVGGSISLSPPDLSGARKGLMSIIFFLLLFNLISLWFGNFIDYLFLQMNYIFIAIYAILILALFINWIIAIVLALLIKKQ